MQSWDTSEKLPKLNNNPVGENSPNLMTLEADCGETGIAKP
jgi:hypothetical protein